MFTVSVIKWKYCVIWNKICSLTDRSKLRVISSAVHYFFLCNIAWSLSFTRRQGIFSILVRLFNFKMSSFRGSFLLRMKSWYTAWHTSVSSLDHLVRAKENNANKRYWTQRQWGLEQKSQQRHWYGWWMLHNWSSTF